MNDNSLAKVATYQPIPARARMLSVLTWVNLDHYFDSCVSRSKTECQKRADERVRPAHPLTLKATCHRTAHEAEAAAEAYSPLRSPYSASKDRKCPPDPSSSVQGLFVPVPPNFYQGWMGREPDNSPSHVFFASPGTSGSPDDLREPLALLFPSGRIEDCDKLLRDPTQTLFPMDSATGGEAGGSENSAAGNAGELPGDVKGDSPQGSGHLKAKIKKLNKQLALIDEEILSYKTTLKSLHARQEKIVKTVRRERSHVDIVPDKARKAMDGTETLQKCQNFEALHAKASKQIRGLDEEISAIRFRIAASLERKQQLKGKYEKSKGEDPSRIASFKASLSPLSPLSPQASPKSSYKLTSSPFASPPTSLNLPS
jgi:hypothetical protein